jgi:hypothetical protein
MKTTFTHLTPKVALLGLILAANVAMAQEAVTTTTSAGTVREFTPNAFTVTTTSSPTPVRYTYSKTTTYTDENGNPVSVETVRSGAPVTVYYDRNGDQLMATRVIVHKSVDTSSDGTVSRETTTTTTAPAVVPVPDATVTTRKTTTTTTETTP